MRSSLRFFGLLKVSLFSRTLLAAALLCLFPPLSRAADGAVVLFDGKDLTGWRQPTGTWTVAKGVSLDPANPESFIIAPGQGIMVNSAKTHTVNLVTEREFGDVQAHVEFCITRHSNSGVYLMGRYEVQVYDSYGVEKDKYPGIECGGLYPRWINGQNIEGHSPSVNASKPPGEWQSFDITFRAPRFDADGKKVANAKFVKVVHNGKVIHENVELNGPTRSAMTQKEKPTGPLLLQGDHGPVAYRNLWVKALNLN
jgi:3-keto-disaccharide hydrolase